MTLIAVEDGTSTHTGSTVVGAVAGTLAEGFNTFVTISGVKVLTEGGVMAIPSHQYVLIPPTFHSHAFSPNVLAQSYVKIAGQKIAMVGDSYSGDATAIDGAGSNTFVTIS